MVVTISAVAICLYLLALAALTRLGPLTLGPRTSLYVFWRDLYVGPYFGENATFYVFFAIVLRRERRAAATKNT